MANVFLGVDVGTSGTKSLAMTADGAILASASAEYPCSNPKPGWSEQDPELWWTAAQSTVAALLAKGSIKADDVKAIGLSGQMHGSVFLDADDVVVRPALLWNDQRTAAECAEIESAAGGRDALLAMVANPALTGFTAPKILWLRNHEPRHFERVRKVLLPKDYVRLRLTGEYATEVSDASGTLLLDVVGRRWSRPLLDKLRLDPSLLPEVYESPEISGRLTAAAAKALGLNAGTPVVGGGGDQAAGAVGNGIVAKGVVSAVLGTSGVVFAHSDEPKVDPAGRLHTFCHAAPGKWHQMGVMLSAGGSLQWFRNQVGCIEIDQARAAGVDPYVALSDLAATAPLGCEGLYFLPYLTGERTPYADPAARGAWIGLTPRHGRAALVRAVFEGVTYGMRDSLDLIRGMGVPIDEVRASGGGARSPFWRQMQADVYGSRVVVVNAEEGPAYGAALLAAVGAGEYATVEEACAATIRVVGETSPNPESKIAYDRAFPLFGELYHALKDLFPKMSAV
ncbi:MAG: xylulokinase [Planctomycetia bacterium]